MKKNKDTTDLLYKGKQGLLQLVFSRVGIAAIFLLLQLGMLFYLFERVASNYLHLFYGGALAITVFGYIFLINSRSDVTVKITWMVVFTVLPIIGIFLYFYTKLELGQRLERRRLIRIKKWNHPAAPCHFKGGSILTHRTSPPFAKGGLGGI